MIRKRKIEKKKLGLRKKKKKKQKIGWGKEISKCYRGINREKEIKKKKIDFEGVFERIKNASKTRRNNKKIEKNIEDK
jgi:hypothetical protein